MSYDISFKVKVEGVDRYVNVGHCNANTTWNVRRIIEKSTGLLWENEANNGLCANVMPKIIQGYEELLRHPDKYKHLEPPNGWGTISGTVRFFDDIIDAWECLLFEDAELAKIATFWIE